MNSNKLCQGKHTTYIHKNPFARYIMFLFHRKKALASFQCEGCGISLQIPRMNVVLKLVVFWISVLTPLLLLRFPSIGAFSSSPPPFISLCLIYVIPHVAYWTTSSAVLSFGKWLPSECTESESSAKQQLRIQNYTYLTIINTGILVFIGFYFKIYMVVILICSSLVGLLISARQKRWKTQIIAAAALIYSVLCVLFFPETLGKGQNVFSFLHAAVVSLLVLIA